MLTTEQVRFSSGPLRIIIIDIVIIIIVVVVVSEQCRGVQRGGKSSKTFHRIICLWRTLLDRKTLVMKFFGRGKGSTGVGRAPFWSDYLQFPWSSPAAVRSSTKWCWQAVETLRTGRGGRTFVPRRDSASIRGSARPAEELQQGEKRPSKNDRKFFHSRKNCWKIVDQPWRTKKM